MSTLDTNTRPHGFLTEFIQLYRSYPCLWQFRCTDYKNKILRSRAYDALAQKLKEVDPNADREAVKKKINTLRTALRREHKKVRISQRMGSRHRYKSSLWYYEILKFVAEQTEEPHVPQNRSNLSNREKDENGEPMSNDGYQEDVSMRENVVEKVELSSRSPTPEIAPFSAFQPVILETEGSYGRRYPSPEGNEVSTTRKVYSQNYEDNHQQREPCQDAADRQHVSFLMSDDDFETFGRYVASKLRKSMQRQSMIAEKIIADVLLRANLGSLDENTSLTDRNHSKRVMVMTDRQSHYPE